MAKKSMKLGGGGRFEALVQKIMKEQGVSREQAEKIAAFRGRKKYGNRKFQAMAAAGRKRNAKKG